MRCSKLSWHAMSRFTAHAATAFIIGRGPQVRITGLSPESINSPSMRSSKVITLPSLSSMLYTLSAYLPAYSSPKRTLR